MNADKNSLETAFSIAICRQSGDTWQSKAPFVSIFDLRSSIVLTLSGVIMDAQRRCTVARLIHVARTLVAVVFCQWII